MFLRAAMNSSTLKPTVHQMVAMATMGMAKSGSLNQAISVPATRFTTPKVGCSIQPPIMAMTAMGKMLGMKKIAWTRPAKRVRRQISIAMTNPRAVSGITVNRAK
ncbi:hypothetical protein D3C76_1524720 [compost metagenome]